MQYFSQTFSGSYDGSIAILLLCVFALVALAVVFIIIFPFFYISGRIRRKVEEIHNQRLSSIIAQYEPPRGLSPAEVGYLYDLRCGKSELIATLFDLEIKGIIKIKSGEKAEVLDEHKYQLLKEYEKIAIRSVNQDYAKNDAPKQIPLEYIFNEGQPQAITLTLPADKSLASFNQAVKQSLIIKGIPIRSFWVGLLKRALVIFITLCLLPIFFFASVDGTFNSEAYEAWSAVALSTAAIYAGLLAIFVWPVYVIFSIAAVYMWANVAGRYWLNTKKARAVWPDLEGYKKFIESVDIDNIQFEATDAHGYSVKETLPYAIVFNLETKWQKLLAKRAIS